MRFLRTLRWLCRHRLLSAHNVRAAWIQRGSTPIWVTAHLDVSDEEWERFMEALNQQQEVKQ